MSKLFVLVLIGVLVHFCASYSSQLVLVLAICRHGQRAPLETYAKDPFKDFNWGVDYGHLTNMYDLGKWFRKRYDSFLPARYSKADFMAFSADSDKCLQSASACAAGMYPPDSTERWNHNIRWHPIPIHVSRDALLYRKIMCPKHERLLNELFACEMYKKVARENEKFFKYLCEMSGETVNNLHDVTRLFGVMEAQSHFNVTFPEWIQASYEKMHCLARMELISHTYTPELSRMRTGPLLNLILNLFDEALVNVTTSLKFVLYMGHEGTLVNILNTMKIYDYHWPEVGETVLLELRRDDTKSFVNMLLKNSTKVSKLALKECQFSCELSKFKEILQPVRITLADWDRECPSS